ncbi:M23 family metallopeptidase [Persephonella sp.]
MKKSVILLLLFIWDISFANGVRILTGNFYPGGLNIAEIKDYKGAYIEIISSGKKYTFPALSSKVFFGIPYSAGKMVELNIIRNGKVIYREFIRIKPKKYPVSRITVKERKLTRELLERIKKESALIKKVLSIKTEKLFREESFIPPLDRMVISTPFGAKRIINGKKRSIHWGTDFAAPEGTPVYATLSGRVVLAQELYYTGKTVIINHGLGLFSLYAHLSRINVREGQQVKGGQLIGNVGSTGRSTGPHLHFGIYINRLRVDPVLALRLNL